MYNKNSRYLLHPRFIEIASDHIEN